MRKYLLFLITVFLLLSSSFGCKVKRTAQDDGARLITQRIIFNQLQDSLDCLLDNRLSYDCGELMSFVYIIIQQDCHSNDTIVVFLLSNEIDVGFFDESSNVGAVRYRDCDVVLNYTSPIKHVPFVSERMFDKNRLDSLINERCTNSEDITIIGLRYSYSISDNRIKLLSKQKYNLPDG